MGLTVHGAAGETDEGAGGGSPAAQARAHAVGEGRPRVPLLTEALFAGRFDTLHRPWSGIFSQEVFHYRDGLSLSERSALAYRRLRVVNSAIDDDEEMVRATDRLVALHEWAGMVDGSLTTLATIHYNLFLGSLLQLDSRRVVDTTPFLRLHQYGTVLITELGYGNNAAELETTATHQPETDTFVLHTPSAAAQKFMPNTGPAGGRKSGLVAARLMVRGRDCGVFLFLVPLRDRHGPLPGIRTRSLSEIPGSAVDHALTSFDRVELPRAALLAGEHAHLDEDGAFRSTLHSPRRRFLRSIGRVTTGKLCLSGAALGGARAALTIAVRYAHRRHTFAPASRASVPVFDYRCHQSRLLGATALAYAGTFLLREVTRRWSAAHDAEPDGAAAAGAEVLVAAAKGWITWQARDIVSECRERCGAQGLLSANRIVDLLTPVESTITAEGDNLVIWTKAAADLLTGRGYLPPPDPAGRAGQLTDRRHLLDLLVRRELQCFQYARRALAQPSAGPMDRWNHAVNPALELVDAYATRCAAQAFLAAVDGLRDSATRDVLDRLFRLFALRRLAPHAAPLLADGWLSAEAVHDLAAGTDRISAALAPHALALVEAFAIPEAVLRAPIATDRHREVYDDPSGPWHRATVNTPPGPAGGA